MRIRGPSKQRLWFGSGRHLCCGGRRYTDAGAHCHSDGDCHANCHPHSNSNSNAATNARAQNRANG
jgi:hypothetical protein